MDYLFLKVFLFQLAPAGRIELVLELNAQQVPAVWMALAQDRLLLGRSRQGLLSATSSSSNAPAAALLLCKHFFLLQVTL